MPVLRRLAIGVLAASTATAVGACTQNDNGNNTLAGRKETTAPAGVPQTTGPAVSPTGDVKPGGPIDLEAKDNEFVPKTVNAAAGTITITFKNTGASPHTFTSADLKVDVNANAGQTTTITIKDAKAGAYKFVCKYHESVGMVGDITVT
jgi:plastocyanin